MEALTKLRALESVIFEVILWPHTLSRALLQALVVPWRLQREISTSWSQRGLEGAPRHTPSPILSWVLIVVVPYLFLLGHLLHQAHPKHDWLGYADGLDWPVKVFVLAALLAMAPLAAARRVQRALGQCRSRDNLHRLFCIQCVVLAPANLLLLSLLAIGAFGPPGPSAVKTALLTASVGSALYSEMAVVWCEATGDRLTRLETGFRCLGGFLWQSLLFMALAGALIVLVRDVPERGLARHISEAETLLTPDHYSSPSTAAGVIAQ